MKAPHGSRPGDRSLFVICLGFAILIAAIVYSAGCSQPLNPVAPSGAADPQKVSPPQPTSRVDPRTVNLDTLTLEHDPWAPGVELCRTQLRAYSDGPNVSWEVDYYTVLAPERCPAEPIE